MFPGLEVPVFPIASSVDESENVERKTAH